MSLSTRQAKIKWQCRRGMLELDLILTPFVNSQLDNLTDVELTAFENLLTYSDPVIYYWLMGNNDELTDKDMILIVERIRIQTINK